MWGGLCSPVMSCYTPAGNTSKSLMLQYKEHHLISSADSKIGPFFPHMQWFWSHLQCVLWLICKFLLSFLVQSCSHVQVHRRPVDSVLQGDPGEEPVPGHAVVSALLPDLQRLLCKQDAAEELMNLCYFLEHYSYLYVNQGLVGLSTGTSWVATMWWIPKHT